MFRFKTKGAIIDEEKTFKQFHVEVFCMSHLKAR